MFLSRFQRSPSLSNMESYETNGLTEVGFPFSETQQQISSLGDLDFETKHQNQVNPFAKNKQKTKTQARKH